MATDIAGQADSQWDMKILYENLSFVRKFIVRRVSVRMVFVQRNHSQWHY